MDRIKRVVLIGSGNVATHMGMAFTAAGISISQVFSRSKANAGRLAQELSCEATSDLANVTGDADLYVIAVSDDAIPEVVAAFPHHDKLLVHTSGSMEMQLLQGKTSRYGVFYPLQTFSRDVQLDFHKVPLCLEASDNNTASLLEGLADRVSERVYWVGSDERRKLHLAAVFACNFVNHMYAHAAEILEEDDLPFEMLRPLISETARKVMVSDPHSVQTGPARRNNKSIIDKHLQMLAQKPKLQKMYQFISESIISHYGNK
jgi:predicted short-subunit dehydrogenase-like oxidoreductase (DUF2520 family)